MKIRLISEKHEMFSKGTTPQILIAFTIFIIYAILAIMMTWPLVTQITTHLPGGSGDTYLHYWNGWWVQQAFSTAQSAYYTDHIFYPNGVSLVTHNIAWLTILPWLLFEPLIGGIAGYNVVMWLNFALCGCALFWLTYKLTDNVYAAFLAGLIYQAWPFRLSHLSHPNLMATYWIPIFFLFLIYTIRKGRWSSGLLAGLAFAMIGYTRWQQLIPATVMALTYFVLTLPSWLPKRREIFFPLVLAGSMALIALLPAILLLTQEVGQENSANLLHQAGNDETLMQTDLLAYLTPGRAHALLSSQTAPRYDRYYPDRSTSRHYVPYIGLVTLFLLLLGIWYQRWQSVPWLLMALILILLALGPLLRVNGEFYEEVPTLYGALSPLYIIRLMRSPGRFNMFLALPVAVLAAYGAAGLLVRQKNRAWQVWLLSSGLAALILLEYLSIPLPLYDSQRSSFYTDLAQEEGQFAVLNLPFDVLKAKYYMFTQSTHQRPILQGNTSRMPAETYAYIDSNPLLQFLRQTHEMPPALTDISRHLAALAKDQEALDVRYIIMHKDHITPDKIEHWRRYLFVQPHYEDDQIIVYNTSLQAERDFTHLQEMTLGLGPVQTVVSTDCLNPNRVLEVDIGWGSSRAFEQDFDVVLALVDQSGAVQQSERYPLSPIWPVSEWHAHSVAWGYYTLTLSPTVPVGEYDLILGLLDSQTGEAQGQAMPLQTLTVSSDACNAATLPEAKDLNALYGNQLRLLEYEITQEHGRVDLMLYWRAERRMESDYTIFVHLFDPATGVPVAQNDAMPRQGQYPTQFWWPGEVVDDQITIFLFNKPAGTYGIAIGVYNPVTGERLPLINGQGKVVEDGRLILDEMVEWDE